MGDVKCKVRVQDAGCRARVEDIGCRVQGAGYPDSHPYSHPRASTLALHLHPRSGWSGVGDEGESVGEGEDDKR